MIQFNVNETFEPQEQSFFVITGSAPEGEIRAGMWVNVPCSEFMTLRAPILKVATALQSGRHELCLHISPELGKILREDEVDIRGQTIEISEERLKPKGTLNLSDAYEMRALTAQAFECIDCGRELKPKSNSTQDFAETLERLAEEARTLGWLVPEVKSDGYVDISTCYCPACAAERTPRNKTGEH